MEALWGAYRYDGAPGILWQDPDIVTDPGDIAEMRLAAAEWPGRVLVAKHKLWPASTGRDTWCWGFGRWQDPHPVMSQELVEWPGWFAMGLTYTPAALLNLAAPEMIAWDYGMTDMGLSRIAREHRITAQVVLTATPKHQHYEPREGDLGWQPDVS